MKSRWKGKIFCTAAGLLAVCLLVPVVVKLNLWQKGIAAALSRGLGRSVRTGDIRLKLLGGVGFEIANVVVEEDPRFGIEPLARMETLEATIALRSLARRRIEFSKMVFVRPSLNVVRNGAGRWSLESLWRAPRASGKGAIPAALARNDSWLRLPRIEVKAGRINFKAENRKTVYVMDDLDLEAFPPLSPEQPWRVRFEGTPDRTDYPVRPVSRIQGQVEFGPFNSAIQSETGTPLRADLSAKDAFLADLIRIIAGSDYGVHGSFDIHLHLAGTTSLLRVGGTADLRDLHRWDLLPPAAASGLQAEIAGILDLEGNSLELTTVSIPLAGGAAEIQGRVANLFENPQPHLQLRLSEVPLGPLAEIARQFTTRLDSRFQAQGLLDGNVVMRPAPELFGGTLNVTQGILQERGTRQIIRFSDTTVAFTGKTGTIGPVEASLGTGEAISGVLHWDLAGRSATVQLRGEAVPLVPFLQWANVWGSRWGTANFSEGNLALDVSVAATAGETPSVRGWAHLSDAVLHSDAVNEPIRLKAARMEFGEDDIRVEPFSASLGDIELEGSIRSKLLLPGSALSASNGAGSLIEFEFETPALEVGALDRLLNPRYRSDSFLGFGDGRPSGSAFFDSLVARGTLRAGQASYQSFALTHVSASVDFHDRLLELRQFAGEVAGGRHAGHVTILLGPGAPSFNLESRFSNVELEQLPGASSYGGAWLSGRISGQLRLASTGRTLEEILERLGGFGEATGRNLTLRGVDLHTLSQTDPALTTRVASLSSSFRLMNREISLQELKLVPRADRRRRGEPASEPFEVTISGTVGFDKKLDLQVMESDGRQFSWAGNLDQPLLTEIFPSANAAPVKASISEP